MPGGTLRGFEEYALNKGLMNLQIGCPVSPLSHPGDTLEGDEDTASRTSHNSQPATHGFFPK